MCCPAVQQASIIIIFYTEDVCMCVCVCVVVVSDCISIYLHYHYHLYNSMHRESLAGEKMANCKLNCIMRNKNWQI